MNKFYFFAGASMLSLSLVVGCQKEVNSLNQEMNDVPGTSQTTSETVLATSNAYTVKLESRISNGDGTWTWTWSVMNPNPGNGSNGTVQDLSHWGLQLGSCATIQDVAAASYSRDGQNWTSFTATYQEDKSQDCINSSVLKFDEGTTGNAKTYYRLVLTRNFLVNPMATLYFKSGANTGCSMGMFEGIGCIMEMEGCSYSQGRWFASPNGMWNDMNGSAYGQLTIGGHHYTMTEGRAIWNSSNKGGIRDAKKGFTQVAAIYLSGSTVPSNASVWADVKIVEDWLKTLGKLSPTNLPHPNMEVRAAADRISQWINEHHCE